MDTDAAGFFVFLGRSLKGLRKGGILMLGHEQLLIVTGLIVAAFLGLVGKLVWDGCLVVPSLLAEWKKARKR